MADGWARSAGRVAHYFIGATALCNYKLRAQSDDARAPRCRICSRWIEATKRKADTPESVAKKAALARRVTEGVRDAFGGGGP